MKFSFLKSDENPLNAFFTDDDKIGDQFLASETVDGQEITGRGDTADDATDDLKERIGSYYDDKKYIAQTAIDRATGLYFFD